MRLCDFKSKCWIGSHFCWKHRNISIRGASVRDEPLVVFNETSIKKEVKIIILKHIIIMKNKIKFDTPKFQ